MDTIVINKIEIKPGMGIYLHNINAINLYIVFPVKEGLAVMAYGQPYAWMNLEKFMIRYIDNIVAICDLSCGHSLGSKIIWKKPEKIVLTLQEIANKLNIPVEFLNIEGMNPVEHNTFDSRCIKPGMVVEVKQGNVTGLCMVTYGRGNCLCLSGKNYWGPLDRFNIYTLKSDIGEVITRVYGLASNEYAYIISTEDRKLLWDRRYTHLYNLREISEAFGIPMDNIEIQK